MPGTIAPPWIEKRFTRLQDFGSHLKGLGGLQTSRIRALKGSTFGPAGKVRRLTESECAAIEQQLRKDGKI